MAPSTCRAALLGAVALAALALAACRPSPRQSLEESAVAMVGGEPLTRADFERDLARELPPELTPEQVEPFKRALLDTRIQQMLLLQEARRLGVTVAPEEVDRGVLRLSSDYPEGNLTEALAQGHRSLADLKADTTVRLTIEKLHAQHVYPRVAVTEEELRGFFQAHEADYHEPEQVRAAQIVVRGLDEARRLQAQLKAGKSFAELARRYSLSADAKVGGDLGFFPRGQMPPEFDEVAFKLPVGGVSDVVSTEYGYHLFRVLERRAARRHELGQVRAAVEQRLLGLKRAAAQEAYVKELHARAQVWVNEPLLQTVRGKGGAPATTTQR